MYCFDPASVLAVQNFCAFGSLVGGQLNEDVTASEIIFDPRPAAAGNNACYFKITPSSKLDVKLTTSGTVPRLICSQQTYETTYLPVYITINMARVFADSLSVTCLNIAVSNVANSGTMATIQIKKMPVIVPCTTSSGIRVIIAAGTHIAAMIAYLL